jgi:hypothetical protein
VPFIGACWRLRTVIAGTVLCAPEHFRLVAPFESDHFRLADHISAILNLHLDVR